MDNRHLFNRKSLKPLRSYLRNKSTSAESVLWNQLKSKNLEALGFTVLRFENRFVFQEPEIVLDEIRKVFRKKINFDK